MEFEEFPKVARLRRGCVITEKIDGTNAQVHVLEDGTVLAGSRNRYITPDADNFGFARWVKEREDELREALGPGRHFGEWWGAGIQRRYGMVEKRFSLFNVGRWEQAPSHCHLVPVLYRGIFSTDVVTNQVEFLRVAGSQAAPGFMQAEGVVIYLEASRTLYKQTLEKDDVPKGQAERETKS